MAFDQREQLKKLGFDKCRVTWFNKKYSDLSSALELADGFADRKAFYKLDDDNFAVFVKSDKFFKIVDYYFPYLEFLPHSKTLYIFHNGKVKKHKFH